MKKERKRDVWMSYEGEVNDCWLSFEHRQILEQGCANLDLFVVVSVTWPYAEKANGHPPPRATLRSMDTFEDRMAKRLDEKLALLILVETFEGKRQWVYYTSDLEYFQAVLNSLPGRKEPFPIAVKAQNDYGWTQALEMLADFNEMKRRAIQ